MKKCENERTQDAFDNKGFFWEMEELQIREMSMDDITRPNNESTAKLAEILKITNNSK